jgi:tetratricopeptide (TPR) repeat protein
VAELRASACATLAAAGRAAASLALGPEAQRYFEQAAELADTDLKRAELLEEAGRALRASGDPQAAEERLKRAIEFHERSGTSLGGSATLMLANIWRHEGRIDESRALLDRFRPADVAGVDPVIRAEALAELASTQISAGAMDDASALTEEALAALEEEQAWGPLASGLITRAVYLILSHRNEEGAGVLRHALMLAEQHDLPRAALRARFNIAAIAIEQGRLGAAVEEVTAGLALARERGDRNWERQLLSQQLPPLVVLGRWNEAVPLAGPLLGGDIDSDSMFGAAFLSQPAFARGEAEMLAVCKSMADERRDSEHIDQRACAFIVDARVALEHGDGASVQRLVTEALAVPTLAAELVEALYDLSVYAAIADDDEQVMAQRQADLEALKPARTTELLRASAVRLRAEIAHRRGDGEGVSRAELEAETLLREAGARPRLAHALLERARRSDDPQALADARAIYVELNASTWLARLDSEFRAVA